MTYYEARDLAYAIEAAGWEVLAVAGERPGGPPATRHARPATRWTREVGPSYANVPQLAATIRVRNPRTGTTHNVSTLARWERLRAWGPTTEGT